MEGEGMRIVGCGEGKLCCTQRVGGDVEVEQSLLNHRAKAIAQEIIDEIISIAEKRVKSAPGGMQDESMEVEKSVGGGRKKVNKKKIHKNDKKVEVLGGKNIVQKKKGRGTL